MHHRSFLVACGLAATVASGASAGGYIAPVAEPLVVAPVIQAAPVADWAGGYVGGSLGYSFGGDDVIGLDFFDLGNDDTPSSRANDLGSVDVKGATAGVHLGYRWQRGQWVFGPELGYEGGSVDASEDVSGTATDGAVVEGKVTSEVKSILGLRMKTGYLVNPATLVYGTIGAVRGKFDYSIAADEGSETVGYTASGYSVGLGAERRMNERLGVFAEWEFRGFSKEDVVFGDGGDRVVTRATPEHHNVKVGVNFRF